MCSGPNQLPLTMRLTKQQQFASVISLHLEDAKQRFDGMADSEGSQLRQQLCSLIGYLPCLQRLSNGLQSQLSPADATALANHALPKLIGLKVCHACALFTVVHRVQTRVVGLAPRNACLHAQCAYCCTQLPVEWWNLLG